jgi:general secretion pathway protein A
MYTAHFSLKSAPFSITPDPQYLYLTECHREALAHLLYGVREGPGFVLLTGEVGTGKTLLCRCLIEQLSGNVDVVLLLNPWLSPAELLTTLFDELRISYEASFP